MKTDHENSILAILFACGEPVSPERIASAMSLDIPAVRGLIERICDTLDDDGSPLQVLSLGGQYQLATRQQYTPLIRTVLNDRRNVPLTPAALEVLAAIAYNQPVTRAYIEQVRGVDSSGIVTSLAEKNLIEEAGRLELPGRPIAFRTTPHFLRTFGLSSLDNLPLSVEDIEEFLPEDLLDGQLDFGEELDLT